MGILSQTLFSIGSTFTYFKNIKFFWCLSLNKVMNVKIIICLALVFVCLKEVAARRKGKPCDGKDNIDECQCEDGETYSGFDEVKDNCGRRNKPVSCTCVDGTDWTPPEKPERPCGSRRNLDECECADGETYSGRQIKRNCKRDDNPIVSCACEDGTTWTPPRE